MQFKLPIAALTLLVSVAGSVAGLESDGDAVIYDQDVRVIHYEPAAYPADAILDHVEGVVVVKVDLNNDGTVAKAASLSGPAGLLPYTVANSSKWQFAPNVHRAAIIVYDFRIRIGQKECSHNSPGKVDFNPPNFVTVIACRSVQVVP